MRNRHRRRMRLNCFGCKKFWRRKYRALCDIVRLPLQYTKEELTVRKIDLEERLKNIDRKLKQLNKEG